MRYSVYLLLVAALTACGPGDGSGTRPLPSTAPQGSTIVEGTQPAGSLTSTTASGLAEVLGRATEQKNIDLAQCQRIATKQAAPAEDRCPGFISEGLVATMKTCAEVGGVLRPVEVPVVSTLDVNADGKPEFLFDFTENYECDGAPSVFSCGSLGCPTSLIERVDGTWRNIGALNAEDVPAIEALAPEGQTRYGMLRGGCSGSRPCDQWAYYRWDGASYQRAMIEARGHWVDVAPGGLWTLMQDYPVLETPTADAKVVERYPAGTEVVVIGEARGAPYRYVSPCNACVSGFVLTAFLRKDY